MTERIIHLTRGYGLRPRYLRRLWKPFRRLPVLRKQWRRNWSHPLPACDGKVRRRDLVSIYDNPAMERAVNCPKCLEWLNEPRGMHRLMVTKGGTDEYLRRMIKEEPGQLRYMDFPSGNTGIVESEDDLPKRREDEGEAPSAP